MKTTTERRQHRERSFPIDFSRVLLASSIPMSRRDNALAFANFSLTSTAAFSVFPSFLLRHEDGFSPLPLTGAWSCCMFSESNVLSHTISLSLFDAVSLYYSKKSFQRERKKVAFTAEKMRSEIESRGKFQASWRGNECREWISSLLVSSSYPYNPSQSVWAFFLSFILSLHQRKNNVEKGGRQGKKMWSENV